MAGIILNGSVIKGLILNGSPVTAMLNGVKVFPTEAPTPTAPTLITTINAISWDQDDTEADVPVSLNYSKRYVCIKFGARPYRWTSWGNVIGLIDGYYNGLMWKGGYLSDELSDPVTLNKDPIFAISSNFVCDNGIDNEYNCFSTCNWDDLEYVKFIFDTATFTVYCYVNDSRLCHGNYTFDLNSFNIRRFGYYTGGTAGPFYVYEGDSLEALEAI